MGYCFFDDSVHDRGGFILGAFVHFTDDPTPRVADELVRHGFEPGRDEFKSGSVFRGDLTRRDLRERLWEALDESRIGFVVVPRTARKELGREALLGLRKILQANRFSEDKQIVYFDQGLFRNPEIGLATAQSIAMPSEIDLRFEQDSKTVLGLQLSDLAAHAAATMLLAELGVVKKVVKVGSDSGYDADTEVDLEFELFARVRYNVFRGPKLSVEESGKGEPHWADVRSYGLHIAENCSEVLRRAADSRLGMIYLGCIH